MTTTPYVSLAEPLRRLSTSLLAAAPPSITTALLAVAQAADALTNESENPVTDMWLRRLYRERLRNELIALRPLLT